MYQVRGNGGFDIHKSPKDLPEYVFKQVEFDFLLYEIDSFDFNFVPPAPYQF